MRSAISSLSSPDHGDSPFGWLGFFDGVPTPGTVSTTYDALDLMRGIEVFLNAMPGASLVAFRRGLPERPHQPRLSSRTTRVPFRVPQPSQTAL
jgi:hypothetical protein